MAEMHVISDRALDAKIIRALLEKMGRDRMMVGCPACKDSSLSAMMLEGPPAIVALRCARCDTHVVGIKVAE